MGLGGTLSSCLVKQRCLVEDRGRAGIWHLAPETSASLIDADHACAARGGKPRGKSVVRVSSLRGSSGGALRRGVSDSVVGMAIRHFTECVC